MAGSKLLTEDEVVQRGFNKRTLQQWRHAKKEIPYVKCGRLVRYREEDLEKYISNNMVAVGGDK